ncbi:MAG: PEP-CTERM sorting domain-containing protein [Pseudomonadota bacterium]
MKSSLFMATAALAAAVSATPASASTTIVDTLGDFDGPRNTGGFPINLGSAGVFTYDISSNATIVSAFLSGTFGTDQFNFSTASFDVDLDGTQLTVCPLNDPGCFQGGPAFRAFEIALPSSSFASLLDGSANLDIIQTSSTIVRYGTPTLTINLAAVPEPETWALLLLGLFGIGAVMRRREPNVTARISFS